MLRTVLVKFVVFVFFYTFLVQACNSQDASKNEIQMLNKLLAANKSDEKASRVEKKIKITGTDGNEYILYQVHSKDFRDMEECCIALMVDKKMTSLIQLPGYAIELSAQDIDGDSKTEIESLDMSFGQGTTIFKRGIYHFTGKSFTEIHEFKGGNNEGMYDADDKNFKSHTAEFQYKDINGDGKKDLIEKHTINENGKTIEEETSYSFDGKKFTKIK